MNKNEIPQVLAELMRLRGVNQTKLSEDAGVPQPTISRILRGGHQTLELETARKLADYFRVSIDQLIGDEPLDNDIQWFMVKKQWKCLPDYKKAVVGSAVKTLAEQEDKPSNNNDKPQPKRLGGEQRQREQTIPFQDRRKIPFGYGGK